MTEHCTNLAGDRALGEHWEKEFCRLAAKFGRSFTPHQFRRSVSAQAYFKQDGKFHNSTLPDITIWTRPGEHHEVKHKDPTAFGTFGHPSRMFGFEQYRLDALCWFANETGQRVFYTIHDYSKQPDPDREQRKANRENRGSHWLTRDVCELAQCVDVQRPVDTWCGGEKKRVKCCYWSVNSFHFVVDLWRKPEEEATNTKPPQEQTNEEWLADYEREEKRIREAA